MFNEDEDWNDEEEAKVLSKTVLRDNLKSNSSSTVKTKVVGKKSLLRTLQTLGSVPDWKRDEHRQESDSDTEPLSPSKKKKKRRKRQKRVDALGEQQENGEIEESHQEGQAVSKKRKKGNKFDVSKVKTMTEIKTKDNGVAEKVNVSMSATSGGLSRKQWKNKMKNKRKCKNKYRPNKPEEEVNEAESTEKIKPVERVKIESCNNNNNTDNQKPAKRMGKECKPQKRKKSDAYIFVDCPTKTQTVTEETNMEEKVRRSSEAESVGDQEKLSRQGQKPQLSSKQRLKREKLRKMLHSQETDQQERLAETTDEQQVPPEGEEEKLDRSASLRSRMEQRLESARFRYINEVLYSTSSGEAKRMFKQDPQAFWIYHRGYTAQVQRWPANPVDEIIAYIRQKPFSLVVADFGCGDCKIARSVKNKVHSFDLAAACELVTVCDMASVPLPDASVDIVVFCLSLMGTNLADFLAEASRVLKMGGFLKIAEVASRFENVRSFITALTNLGFKMVSKDTQNTHFYSFELVKTGDAPENIKKFGLQLKPCVYKKR